jgi:spore coat protein U-like protein
LKRRTGSIEGTDQNQSLTIMPANSIKKLVPIAALLAACTLAFFSAASHAASSTMTVSATVLNKTGCFFISPTTPMNFGNIDPSLNTNATATGNIVIRCNGNTGTTTMRIARDAGQNALTNNLRMQHSASATDFLPYSLNLAGANWATGLFIVGTIPSNANYSFNLSGTVLPADYRGALMGSYTDNVVLTITP